jgi:hypothetical protein
MEGKWRIVWEGKPSIIVKLFISFLTFPQANVFGVTRSVWEYLQDL